MDFHFVEVLLPVLEFDERPNTRPMTREVKTPNELMKFPDKITDNKGESSKHQRFSPILSQFPFH
jgi:hypothetical protein